MNYFVLPLTYDIFKGGEGSGHFGHEGRPGEVGGSDGNGEGRSIGMLEGIRSSIEEYTGENYAQMRNEYIQTIGKDEKELTERQRTIRQFQEHLSDSTIEEGTMVYRGAHFDSDESVNSLVDSIQGEGFFSLNSFSSFSSDLDIAEDFASGDKRGIVFRLRSGGNLRGLDVSSISSKSFEKEIVLAAGQKFGINKIERGRVTYIDLGGY